MKKEFVVMFVLVLCFAFVFASAIPQDNSPKMNDNGKPPMIGDEQMIGGEKDEHGCLGPAGYSWNESENACVREWLSKSDSERYQDMNRTQERENNRLRLNCSDCNYTGEGNKTKLQIKLKDGRNFEIKIMPETASENALQRLRIKNCNESNNCTIQLKEVGQGNETRVNYELKAKKTYKVLGLFKNSEEVSSEVDSETGEVVSSKRPWWSFLASESD